MKISLYFILLLCLPASAEVATYTKATHSAFSEGLKSLESNNYTKAITVFSDKQFSHNSAALINLGIAQYKLEDTAMAVGSFRKARAFSSLFTKSSRESSLWLNKVGFSTNFFTDYRAIFYEASRVSWALLYCLFIALLVLTVLAFLKKIPTQPTVALLLILFLFSLNKIYFNKQVFGTLQGKLIELKSGPSNESSTINEAVEGGFIRVLSHNNDWFAIELADKRQGWLSKDFIIFH